MLGTFVNTFAIVVFTSFLLNLIEANIEWPRSRGMVK